MEKLKRGKRGKKREWRNGNRERNGRRKRGKRRVR